MFFILRKRDKIARFQTDSQGKRTLWAQGCETDVKVPHTLSFSETINYKDAASNTTVHASKLSVLLQLNLASFVL